MAHIIHRVLGRFIGAWLARPTRWPTDYLWRALEKHRTLRAGGGTELRRVLLPRHLDGNLDTWLFLPRRRPRPALAILLVHGFSISRAEMARLARHFLERGAACALVDLPRHGGSPGICTFGVDESLDIVRAARSLKEDYGFEQVVLGGMSLGAATVLQTVKADPPVEAIVALASFATFREVAADFIRSFTGRQRAEFAAEVVNGWSETAGHHPDEASPLSVLAASESRIPILFIHGARDVHVPPSHTARMVEAYRGPREVIWEEGAGHYTIQWPQHREQYMPKVFAFLERHGVRFNDPATSATDRSAAR